jgi:hypothetical protein
MKPSRASGVVRVKCKSGWERIRTIDHPLKAERPSAPLLTQGIFGQALSKAEPLLFEREDIHANWSTRPLFR